MLIILSIARWLGSKGHGASSCFARDFGAPPIFRSSTRLLRRIENKSDFGEGYRAFRKCGDGRGFARQRRRELRCMLKFSSGKRRLAATDSNRFKAGKQHIVRGDTPAVPA